MVLTEVVGFALGLGFEGFWMNLGGSGRNEVRLLSGTVLLFWWQSQGNARSQGSARSLQQCGGSESMSNPTCVLWSGQVSPLHPDYCEFSFVIALDCFSSVAPLWRDLMDIRVLTILGRWLQSARLGGMATALLFRIKERLLLRPLCP